MYCKNCFKKITSNSKFCRYCGTPVQLDDSDLDCVKSSVHDKSGVSTGTRSGHQKKSPVVPVIIAVAAAIIVLTTAVVLVKNSSVFQKTESIAYKDYIGVWQERGGEDFEENGGVRLEIHGLDADTLIISMEFYGVAEDDIFVDELGAVIKDGKAYYSFTNDGHGNSGNGVLTFEGRDIEWKSTVNKNDPVIYKVSKVASSDPDDEIDQPQDKDGSGSDKKDNKSEKTEYILPDSDKEYVTSEQLEALTQEELRIARNEIVARHGRMFRDPTLDAYFRSKDWYQPAMDPDTFDKQIGDILNKYEMKNIALIKELEE